MAQVTKTRRKTKFKKKNFCNSYDGWKIKKCVKVICYFSKFFLPSLIFLPSPTQAFIALSHNMRGSI